jgi:hypothetical protein
VLRGKRSKRLGSSLHRRTFRRGKKKKGRKIPCSGRPPVASPKGNAKWRVDASDPGPFSSQTAVACPVPFLHPPRPWCRTPPSTVGTRKGPSLVSGIHVVLSWWLSAESVVRCGLAPSCCCKREADHQARWRRSRSRDLLGSGGCRHPGRALPGAVPWRHVRLLLVPDIWCCRPRWSRLDRQATSSAALTDNSDAITSCPAVSTHAETLASSSFQLERFETPARPCLGHGMPFSSWAKAGGRTPHQRPRAGETARRGSGICNGTHLPLPLPPPRLLLQPFASRLSLHRIRLANEVEAKGRGGCLPM